MIKVFEYGLRVNTRPQQTLHAFCILKQRRYSTSSQSSNSHSHNHQDLKEFPPNFNHYQILNIPQDSDATTIKKAFRKLSKRYHPDMNHRIPVTLKPIIKNNYLRITASYETLSNKAKRSAYDLTLSSSSSSASPRDFKNNDFYNHRKTYSSGGINRTRNHVHFGPGYQHSTSTYSNIDDLGQHSRNQDVPHFDFDNHLRGNLWFERRMINKRIGNNNEHRSTNTKNKTTARLDQEINDTLNLHRFGGYNNMKQVSYSLGGVHTTIAIVGIGITIGTLYNF